MTSVTTTVKVGDDMSNVVGHLFRNFPKGTMVQLALTEVTAPSPVPGLDEYRQQISKARAEFPQSLWQTTAETMTALREGE